VLLAGCAVLAAAMLVATVLAWRHLGPAGIQYVSATQSDGRSVEYVRGSLRYNVVVTVATVLITTALALLVRRPWPWARWGAWCALGVIGLLLFLGLNAGADPAGSTPSDNADAVSRLYYDLLPSWYPSLTAVLGLAVLVALLTAAIMLARSSIADYYRPASRVADPRWAAFVEGRQKRVAGEEE
jgi:hypothetical protein